MSKIRVTVTCPLADRIIILGDFNARVVGDFQTWTVLGRHGVGKCNAMVCDCYNFAIRWDFILEKSCFVRRISSKTTWMYPGSKQWHLIDNVFVRRRKMRDICSIRAMRVADCWTDHWLVRAKVRFLVRPKLRDGSVSNPKQLNVARFKDELVEEQLVHEMEGVYCDGRDAFKTSVYEACEKVLGYC